MARYVARKYNLYGDEKAGAVSDMVIDGHDDLLKKLIPAIYPTFDAEKLAAFKADGLPGFMAAFEKIAADHVGEGFLGGDKPNLGDLQLFLIAESYIFDYQFASADAYPKLAALKERVAANENVKKYLASEKRFPAHQFNK